ncbi:MAG: hypothetical protein HY918_03010 [Candidatus Doudnabacteria bacterium]|nr:hypothetical protein [Candidatus Doudnabacteria bacterium]
METNQPQPQNNQSPSAMPTEQMLVEILENTRKTKNYMKWSLYITIVLVVLPLLAALFIVPFAMQSLTSTYGSLIQ